MHRGGGVAVWAGPWRVGGEWQGIPVWTDGEGDEQPVHGGPVERLPGLTSL